MIIKLDIKKLLGFRIGNGKHASKIGQKVGSKVPPPPAPSTE